MHTAESDDRPSLIMRNDTLLGVCEGLGEDLGINGNWLRIAFALALFVNPLYSVLAYLAAGIVVLATRLLVREPRAGAQVVSLNTKAASEAEAEDMQLAA